MRVRPTVSLLALAGQAYATLIINVGGSVGNVSAVDFLNITDTRLLVNCQSQCSDATNQVLACGTDDYCLCGPRIVSRITACQQCMFDYLIVNFAPNIDPRAGSATALTAYSAACLAAVNITIPSQFITLQLPSKWNGPYIVELSEPWTIAIVAMGAFLGVGILLLLSNM